MTIFAYLYTDPLLDTPRNKSDWGMEVDRIYEDFGKRNQLLQLWEDCKQNKPDYLLVQRLEELGNSVTEVSDRLSQFESLGITIIAIQQSYNSSELDNTNPRHLRTNLTYLLRQIQDYQRSRRIRHGHAQNRIKALPPPGKAPYGYRRGKDRYIIDRSTAPVIKEFFTRFILLGSLRGAVRYLEQKYGKKISVSTGRRWLTNPVYRGALSYQNGEVISDTHIPIISQEEAAQIDRLLRRNRRLPSRTASAPRSLAGLVICQECQSNLTVAHVTTRNHKYEYLYLRPICCTKKPKCQALLYEKVLNATIERICEDLPRAVQNLSLPNLDSIKGAIATEIQQKQAIIEQVNILESQGILDEETANLRRYKLKTEVSQLRRKLAELPPVNLMAIAKTVSLPQFWLDLSESERRFYFREFIKQIEIIRHSKSDWELKLNFIF